MEQKNYSQLLIDFKSLPKHKRSSTFMEIAGYPHYENVCSNILKFYLNPKNDHGLKDLVLNSLVKKIDDDFYCDVSTEEIKISREFRTSTGKKIDIFIETENYVVGVENKIYHYLHNDLEDYERTVKQYSKNSRKPRCILLTLNELESDDEIDKVNNTNFKNITYPQLFESIKKDIGNYLNNQNSNYVNHLTDFIRTIENLNDNTMGNKKITEFFKNNTESIQNLFEYYEKYKKSLFIKAYHLQEAIPKNDFARLANKQWIHDKRVLVHDYDIKGNKIAIDTSCDINGWKIRLFGRDANSRKFLFNHLLSGKNTFLSNQIENYKISESSISEYFDIDEKIPVIAKNLAALLKCIEKFKKEFEKTSDKKD